MPSLMLIVFVLQVIIHLVNTVGAATVNNLLWSLYNKFPSSTSADHKRVAELRREAVRLKRELSATSAQDQFAKWAKLQRQYDKTIAEHDKKAQDLKSFEASFGSTVSVLRWLATNGLRFFLQFWCGKIPMFWIPAGWVPWHVEWLLSFPKAPIGSISINVWFLACASAVKIIMSGVTAALAYRNQNAREKGEGEPIRMGGVGSSRGEEKKEL